MSTTRSWSSLWSRQAITLLWRWIETSLKSPNLYCCNYLSKSKNRFELLNQATICSQKQKLCVFTSWTVPWPWWTHCYWCLALSSLATCYVNIPYFPGFLQIFEPCWAIIVQELGVSNKGGFIIYFSWTVHNLEVMEVSLSPVQCPPWTAQSPHSHPHLFFL